MGNGPIVNTLQKAVRDRGLKQQISFLGSRDDVRALMAEADAFVLPSEFEGLPLVLLEAMAAGLPVIGTRVCGIREVIRDGVCGRLVPAADPAALGLAILEALLNPKKAAYWCSARGNEWHAHLPQSAWLVRRPQSTVNCCRTST